MVIQAMSFQLPNSTIFTIQAKDIAVTPPVKTISALLYPARTTIFNLRQPKRHFTAPTSHKTLHSVS